MKKRVLSLLMALALCFTMLPTAALAQQTGAADVYTTGEDTAVQGKRAVRAAQALIDALPDEVTADNAEEIAAQLANLDETLAALTEEQYAQLDTTRYEALCAALVPQVSLTAERGGEHADHPICGAAHKDINGHTGACADVTWTAWDGVSDITYDANNTAYVYLRDNAERDSALEIANGYTLYLCLSGHSLTKNKTGKSVIKVGDNATLSLCDCSDAQSGKLTHGTTASGLKYTGHGVSLGYRSTFNMYGGSITGNRADTGGGVSLASEYSYAKFNMYGGSITNNAATNGDGGGGVHNLFGTFTMYGGSITGNSADTRCGGGGVYLARMGEFVMKGGEITGNTAKYGGGVYTAVNGNTGLTVSGDAAITGNSNTAGKDENVYLVSGKTIEIGADGLGEKASIGVTTADTITTGSYVTVANGAENGYTDGNIFSDAGGAYCTLQEGDNVNLYNG